MQLLLKVSRLSSIAVGISVGAFLCIGIMGAGLVALWYYTHPMLAMVNASEHATMRVFLDGTLLVGDLRQASSEGDACENFVKLRIPAGDHQLMVLDGRGQMVEERAITLGRGGIYFYAPAHSSHATWSLETEACSPHRGSPTVQPLDVRCSFWKLPMHEGFANFLGPDSWFQDAHSIAHAGSAKKTYSALRQIHRQNDVENLASLR